MTLYRDADRFRRALLRHERRAAGEMVRAYGVAWRRIRQRLDALLEQMAAVQATGQPVELSWLFEQQRLEALQRQVERELQRWARDAEPRIVALQREAVQAAERQAEAETMLALGAPPPGVAMAAIKGSWTRLSSEAITDLVGFSGDGTPLGQLLADLGAEAGQAVREALIAGLATGENPRSIARRVKEAFGGDLVRAMRVSRTETMRAYRTAAVRSYQANSDVVKGWIWNAACDARTCVACWALHGSKHSFEDDLQDHPNGRCARSPWVKTWEELGFEGMDEKPPMKSGAERFDELTPEEQDKILGKAGGAAYRGGAAKLSDFATTKTSARWGTHVQRKSLKGALGAEGAAEWQRRIKTPWEDWEPARPDATLVGTMGQPLRSVIGPLSGVRQVYSVPGTVAHYNQEHNRQFDVARAEKLLPGILADPKEIYRGSHENGVVLVGWYDETHYLLVPIKTLPGELWLNTMHIDNIERFYRRGWVKAGAIYKRS